MTSLDLLSVKLRGARFSFAAWLLFALFIGLCSWFFFPGSLFWSDGGVQGFGLVVVVDFVLGPLLFFLVYNPGKTRSAMLFDVVFLACIQVAAMAWGGYRVFSLRPAAVSYVDGFFVSVVPEQFSKQGVTSDWLRQLSDERPPILYVRPPKGAQAINDMLSRMSKDGILLAAQKQLLDTLPSGADEIFSRDDLFRTWLRGHGRGVWEQWLGKHPGDAIENHRYAWFAGRYVNVLWVFSHDAKLEGYVLLEGDVFPKLAVSQDANRQAASTDPQP